MSSTYNDVRAAIEGRIATELALAPAYPVSYQNVPFSPPNNTPWVQVFIRFGDNNYATLTSGLASTARPARWSSMSLHRRGKALPLTSPLQSASRISLTAPSFLASSLTPPQDQRR
jgi:hypothetical protein